MYNKLCNLNKMDFFLLIGFICKRDKDHQMSFKKK